MTFLFTNLNVPGIPIVPFSPDVALMLNPAVPTGLPNY
jgi:hypothetical protein